MKCFEEPRMEIMQFSTIDVITTSPDPDENAGAEDGF